jgi:hypothetical protein
MRADSVRRSIDVFEALFHVFLWIYVSIKHKILTLSKKELRSSFFVKYIWSGMQERLLTTFHICEDTKKAVWEQVADAVCATL